MQANLKLLADNNLMPQVSFGAPVNGTTGAGEAGPGCLCYDVTNKFLYINTNTLASPTWTKVGLQT